MKKLLLALLFASTAQAATTNLQVSGTISTTCVFGSTTNGAFGYSPLLPTVMDTNSNGGTPASVGLSYSGTPTVTVSEPTSFSATPAGYSGTPSFSSAVTSANGGNMSYSSGLASYTQTSGTSDLITLNIGVSNGSSAFPLGTYTTSSTVTCN